MSRWRIVLVITLLVLPFALLAGVGSYYLWTLRWGFYFWCLMAACMSLGYVLAWYWQHKRRLLYPPDFAPPPHWTQRDAQAWKLVEARANAAAQLPAEKFSDVTHYLNVGQAMALELANFYHPGTQDPIGNLTVPEMLAVVELAAHDLAVLVDSYLPGGHLLTVKDWRRAKQAADWYQSANNLYWAVSALFSPVNTGVRYAASRIGMARPFEMLQQNLLLWFYTAFIHRLGTYLIELNSGRLRIGADRYRALMESLKDGTAPARPSSASAAAEPADQVRQVTVTLMGQVKAGKSSLINALLGEQRAKTDALPATSGVERYQLHTEGIPTRLVLLDTVGYAHTGPKGDQVAATRDAAQQSDLLLLVLHARNPARQADLAMLQELRSWFASHPDLKKPPVLAVVTHIDLLSPALEWSPPYNWQEGKRTKEENIRQALGAVRQQLGEFVTGIVPVCTAAGKVSGIEEGLLPAIAECLDEAHGVALLRCLRAEVDTGKVRKVFAQMLAVGKKLAEIAWQRLTQEPLPPPRPLPAPPQEKPSS
jgi:predicted GTPase